MTHNQYKPVTARDVIIGQARMLFEGIIALVFTIAVGVGAYAWLVVR